jgi:hypothetical protein
VRDSEISDGIDSANAGQRPAARSSMIDEQECRNQENRD